MEKISYEEATKELNSIINKIEKENIPMSEALKLFERGQELIKICYTELDRAKGKLTEIKENLGKLEEI